MVRLGWLWHVVSNFQSRTTATNQRCNQSSWCCCQATVNIKALVAKKVSPSVLAEDQKIAFIASPHSSRLVQCSAFVGSCCELFRDTKIHVISVCFSIRSHDRHLVWAQLQCCWSQTPAAAQSSIQFQIHLNILRKRAPVFYTWTSICKCWVALCEKSCIKCTEAEEAVWRIILPQVMSLESVLVISGEWS